MMQPHYAGEMELNEKVREWLVDLKFGVINEVELITRVDREIDRLDNPPYFLIALSLGQYPTFENQVDLLKDRVTGVDLGLLAKRLQAYLNAQTMDLEDIGVVATRIDYNDRYWEAWYPFCVIADELDLIEQGVKDASGFRDLVIDCLSKAARFAG